MPTTNETATPLELVEDPREALTLVVKDFTLDTASETNVLDAYAPYFANARALASRARELIAQPTDVKTDAKSARVLRIALKDERVAAEKARKKLNEDALRYQRAVNGINAAILLITEPLEAKLKEIEDAEEIAAQKARDTLRAQRAEELRPYCTSTDHYNLDTMPAEAYSSLLNGLKYAKELEDQRRQREEAERAEAARKAEEERVAREQAAAAEKARLEAENARLQAEKAETERLAALERERAAEALRLAEEAAQKERDRIAAEQAEKDRIAAGARARELRESLERQAERDRIAAEQKAEADRQAQIEREKREALEAAERDRLAAEEQKRLEALEAERRAAAAPDKEKLLLFADEIQSLVPPRMSTEDAGCYAKQLKIEIHELACRARGFADKI
jgi:hypothetical protein